MHKLAETLQPLNALLKKNARWEWTSNCEVAFQRVKDQLATAPQWFKTIVDEDIIKLL